jgi:hypothetical protein
VLPAELEAEQAPSGAFPCLIKWGRGPSAYDENGFATALVLRRMRRRGIRSAATERSLDFLEACAAGPPGAFSFWPRATRPAWAAAVPPDADDTAAIILELCAHGRRTRAQALDTLVDVLIASLTGPPAFPGPAWRRAGVFPTWLDLGGADRANVVDCGVNANILALMAALGARELPGFAQAVEMIDAAVDWCGQDASGGAAKRADTIAPYYASPHAVAQILDDAVWCGATELMRARDRLLALIGPAPAGEIPLWRNAYAGPVWHCRALDLLTAGKPGREPDPVS